MIQSYGDSGIRPLLLLALFAQWAKDNPSLGADEFIAQVLVPLGMTERTTGYKLTRVLPKHSTVVGDRHVFDESGADISSSVRTETSGAEDTLKLTPSNLDNQPLFQFGQKPMFYPGRPLDANNAAWSTTMGITSLPFPFNSPSFANVARVMTYTVSTHAFEAVLSVAGFHVPYFVGTNSSGHAFVSEPGCCWIRSSEPVAGSPEYEKLVPSESWTDLSAVQSGFVPSVSMGNYKMFASPPSTAVYSYKGGSTGLVACGRTEYQTDGGATSKSVTSHPYNHTYSCKSSVFKLAVSSMLQWARGERRSCDSPVMPGFGPDSAIVTRLPVDPLACGFEPVWETAISKHGKSYGNDNVLALDKLLEAMVNTAAANSVYRNSITGLTGSPIPFDKSVIGALFDKIPLAVSGEVLPNCLPGLSHMSGSVNSADLEKSCLAFSKPKPDGSGMKEFNVFRGSEAKRISARIPSARRAFQFIGMGTAGQSKMWSSGDGEANFSYGIEMTMKRFAQYA